MVTAVDDSSASAGLLSVTASMTFNFFRMAGLICRTRHRASWRQLCSQEKHVTANSGCKRRSSHHNIGDLVDATQLCVPRVF